MDACLPHHAHDAEVDPIGLDHDIACVPGLVVVVVLLLAVGRAPPRPPTGHGRPTPGAAVARVRGARREGAGGGLAGQAAEVL